MRDKGGEGAEIGLGCKGLSLSKMTKMKGRVAGRGEAGSSQWLGKSIWRKKGKEYLIQKPSLHDRTEVSGQNLWDTHIACDLKITRNFAFSSIRSILMQRDSLATEEKRKKQKDHLLPFPGHSCRAWEQEGSQRRGGVCVWQRGSPQQVTWWQELQLEQEPTVGESCNSQDWQQETETEIFFPINTGIAHITLSKGNKNIWKYQVRHRFSTKCYLKGSWQKTGFSQTAVSDGKKKSIHFLPTW